MTGYLKWSATARIALAILIFLSSVLVLSGGADEGVNGSNFSSPTEIQVWYEYYYPRAADGVSDSDASDSEGIPGETIPGLYSFPPIAYESKVTTQENTPVEITLLATDPEGDPMTYRIDSLPFHGTLGIITGNTVVYTPDTNTTGSDEFSFSAHDGTWDSNPATVTITIEPDCSSWHSHAFYGSVTLNGEPAPEYTILSVNGTGVCPNIAGNPVATQPDGSYGSRNGTAQNLLVQGCIEEGSPLVFSINGIQAEVSDVGTSGPWQSSYPFRAGGITNLSIRLSVPVHQPDKVYINALEVTISNSSYGYTQTLKLEKKPWVELKVTPGTFDIQITATGYHDFNDWPILGRAATLGIYEGGNLLSSNVTIPFGSKIVRYAYRANETKTFDILISVNENPEIYDLKQITIYVTK